MNSSYIDYLMVQHYYSYMNYRSKSSKHQGAVEVAQALWQSAVLLGLLFTGALQYLK